MNATPWARLGLITRTIGAFMLLGGFLLMAVLSTLWQVKQQETDGAVVNMAGRQRALSLGLAKAALAELEGTGDGATRLRGLSAEFQSALEALLKGDASRGVPPPSPEARRLFEEVRKAWEPLRAGAERVATEAQDEQALRAALNEIDERNHRLLDEAQALVDALRARGDGLDTVEAAASLRMLSQRVPKLSFEIERGGGSEHAADLLAAMDAFDRGLSGVPTRPAEAGPGRDEVAAAHDALQKSWDPIRAAARAVAAQAARRAQLISVGARISGDADAVFEASDAAVNQVTAETQARVDALVRLLWVLGAAGVVLTALFSLMARAGLMPLRELERVASRVAQGDLRQEVKVLSQDEVGRLAEAFATMVGELSAYSGGATGVSQAIGAATVQINASVQEQTSTVTSQAAAVAQATSSLEELKSNAVRNDERARDVLATTKSTIQGMKQVQEQVREIATSIVALSEKTQQIGEILDSVSDIADQSNLLALNASIEASKAGEFGRGFEVVAAEVRSLAQQSQKATLSIRSMLRDIQRAMNAAVMGTEEGTKRVERQSTDLNAATQAVEQIVYATREQTQAIEQIADAVSSVSGSISESQASSSQIAEATRGLVVQAEALKTALSRFAA